MRAKSLALTICAALHIAVAYYFLFLERDYPVAHAGVPKRNRSLLRDPGMSTANTRLESVLCAGRTWDIERLEQAIRSTGRFLAVQCDAQGQFRYKLHLDPSFTNRPRYDVGRHAGAVYALSQLQAWRPDEQVMQALLLSSQFLKKRCVQGVREHDEMAGVWSDSDLTFAAQPRHAQVGTAGISLAALAHLGKLSPDSTPVAELQRIGNFILFMQRPDGGFHASYIPAAGGKSDYAASAYIPGQAALGLLMLYELDPDSKWLVAAARAIAYLAAQRCDRSEIEPDHWSLLATSRLMPVIDRCHSHLSAVTATRHARLVCASMLADQRIETRSGIAAGGFDSNGRTCPTAMRLEGILAAASFLPEYRGSASSELDAALRAGISFLLRAQVTKGPHAGAVTRCVFRLPASHPLYRSEMNRRAEEVRIDYVHHALLAMIAYQIRHRQPAIRDIARHVSEGGR